MKDAFETSGTSPGEPDFRVKNHGSIFLLQAFFDGCEQGTEGNYILRKVGED